MTAVLSIEDMSVEDTFYTMELLWDDLHERAEANDSPNWHGDELKLREQALTARRNRAEGWSTVKRSIRDLLG